MAKKFKVQWDEQHTGESRPSRHSTTVQANSAAEAKAKIRMRLNPNVKVTGLVAVQQG